MTKHLFSLPGLVNDSQLQASYSPVNRSGLSSIVQEQLNKIQQAVEACQQALQHGDDTIGYSLLSDKNVEELITIHETASLNDRFGQLKDKLVDLRELGDGQVSPTISQMFGASTELIEEWFAQLDVAIEQLTNSATTDVQTPLSLFRAKLEFIQNFSDTLFSLYNTIQG